MGPAAIIHAFSVVAAGVGAGLAPAPGSDAPLLVALQTAMIQALSEHYSVPMAHAAAAELVLTLSATMTGRLTVGLVLGRWPGIGTGVRATTAAVLTETIGWAAIQWFERRYGQRVDA